MCGAPAGNANALVHGYYAQHGDRDPVAMLARVEQVAEAARQAGDVAAELRALELWFRVWWRLVRGGDEV